MQTPLPGHRCRRSRRIELTAWDVHADGSVHAEVTCRSCGEAFTATFAPSQASGSAFSEHLALVAATFTLAFANGRLRRGLVSAFGLADAIAAS